MSKLCGCKESCFKHGDSWGHMGVVLCHYLIEFPDHTAGCALDGSIENRLYTTVDEYKLLTKQAT
jgi:hypothetical protein